MSDEMNPADAPTPDATPAPPEQTAPDAVAAVPTEPVAAADFTHEQPAEALTALPAVEEHVALPEHAEAAAEHEPEPEAAEVSEPVAEDTEQIPVEPPTEDSPAVEPETAQEPPTELAPPPTPKPRKSRAKAAKKDEAEESADVATATLTETEAAPAEVGTEGADTPVDTKRKWYVVKIQSGREESIKAAIERKVKIEGLEEFYGQIAIPVEEFVEKKKVRVTDKKTGEKVTQEKNVTKARKKYPGYLFAEVEFNDRILYLFRETSGVGDFVGAAGPMKPPPPMNEREVQQMLTGVIDPKDRGKGGKKTVVKLDIAKGDKVKIRDGAFAGSEGEVKSITEPKDPTDTPKVTVTVTIWGRPVELELDYWHVDKA